MMTIGEQRHMAVMEGMFACEGAERDHYVNMLYELEQGRTTLHYN